MSVHRPRPDGTAGDARLRPGLGVLGALLLVLLVAAPLAAQQLEADVFVARAVLAYEEKRYEDALAALREALALAPEHADALYYSGVVLTALGRFDEAVQALERARAAAPAEPTVLFQLGLAYFGLRDYDRAQPILEQAFAADPKLDGLGYYVGFLRHRKADYEGAVQAFQAGVATDLKIQQLAQFYSGLALASLGFQDRAARELEQAARLLPASPLTAAAERLREVVTGPRARERRFRAEVRVGGFHDDNVAVNPATGTDPLVRDLRSRPHESPGELGSLRLDFVLVRTTPFEATITYSLFATVNNDLHDFDILDHVGGLSGTYRSTLGGRPYALSLQYAYDYLTLGGDAFVRRHTFSPTASLVANAHNVTAVQARYQRSDYAGDGSLTPDERRNGANTMAGLTHLLQFEGGKHLVKAGYQWDLDDTDGRNFRYAGHRILAGVQYTLPWAALRLRYDLDVHLRRYRSLNSILPIDAPGTVRRSDTEYTHTAGLSLPLSKDLTLVAEYQRTNAHSNLAVFTFDRNIFSLSLVWLY